FTENGGVERTDVWQCTEAADPYESPISAPTKWRRTAFGLVNAWDRAMDSYHYNGGTGNFYAFVPWFYLKYVLHESLQYLGYRVMGDFMEDPTTHEQLLPNNTTTDREQ